MRLIFRGQIYKRTKLYEGDWNKRDFKLFWMEILTWDGG